MFRDGPLGVYAASRVSRVYGLGYVHHDLAVLVVLEERPPSRTDSVIGTRLVKACGKSGVSSTEIAEDHAARQGQVGRASSPTWSDQGTG